MKTLIIISLLLVSACARRGDTGAQGPSGNQGPIGVPGVNGSNGEAGPTGNQGPQGPSCSVSTTMAGALITCPDGTSSLITNGQQGVQGAQGQQGVSGTPGSVVTPIQFCSNVTPSYPSTFPESGFCINNQMYGVYSANDGFLALLPPGAYRSNAIGNSCNFTITDNCGVN